MWHRWILLSIFGSAAIAGMMVSLRDGNAITFRALWERYIRQSEKNYTEEHFHVELMDLANSVRLSRNLPMLKFDPVLEQWAQQELAAGVDLASLDVRAKQTLPRYMKVSVCTAGGPTLKLIKDHVHEYLHNPEPAMTHFASALRSTVGGLSNQTLIITGQRLRDFAPELLNRTEDPAFFKVCPHCQTNHISRAIRDQDSYSMECPSCQLTYAVIATDTHGQYRYVNEFLTGYQPPAVFPKGQSRVDQLFTIWSAVHSGCLYVRDPGEGKNQTDRWQTALETQTLGQGDCEDSALWLADWLTARGFEVRVALGKYGDIGGHAWCVVRVDDKEYLLESTAEGNPNPDNPPLVSRVGSRYVPDVLFDRWGIYVRSKPRQVWTGDYWSEQKWTRIEPRKTTLSPDELTSKQEPSRPQVPVAKSLQRDLLDVARMAFVQPSDPKAAPFLNLEEVEHNASTWDLPVVAPAWPGEEEK